MKPPVTRLSASPLTALNCCPQCYRLISYPSTQTLVTCHACGTVVKNGALPSSDTLPAVPGSAPGASR